MLRSLAVKSMNSSDTDVVNSCITGLFSIFSYVTKSKELLGVPFTLKTSLDDKTPIYAAAAPTLIVIHPKEESLVIIFFELSITIDNGSSKSQQVIVTKHLVKEFISSSKILLESKSL